MTMRTPRYQLESLEGRGQLSAADLDPTFGGTGLVTNTLSVAAQAVVVQPSGKVIVGGTASSSTPLGFGLIRYTAAGGLDTSFNGTGKVKTEFGRNPSELFGLALVAGGADSADSSSSPWPASGPASPRGRAFGTTRQTPRSSGPSDGRSDCRPSMPRPRPSSAATAAPSPRSLKFGRPTSHRPDARQVRDRVHDASRGDRRMPDRHPRCARPARIDRVI